MLSIDKKLRLDIEKIENIHINKIILKVLQYGNSLSHLDNDFIILLNDINKLLNDYLEHSYFLTIRDYRQQILGYAVFYVEDLKADLMMVFRQYRASLIDEEQLLIKIYKITKYNAFQLSTCIITQTTLSKNYEEVKNLYFLGLISLSVLEKIKINFNNKQSKVIAKEDIRKLKAPENVPIYAKIKTSKDSKVCVRCSTLDGVKILIEELIPFQTAPPFHPNCRCMIKVYNQKI